MATALKTLGKRPSREKTAAEIKRLRDEEGLDFSSIADKVGLAGSTCGEYYRDPTGEKARERRDRYRGRCKSCGSPTHGSAGPRKAPKLCGKCSRRQKGRWTREAIVKWIVEFNRLNARSPTVGDLSRARDTEVKRPEVDGFDRDEGPGYYVVRDRFGSFPGAVIEAGLDPAPLGPARRWTKKGVIEAFLSEAERRGRPPTSTEWARAEKGRHPTTAAVVNRFGSWSKMRREAGL